MNFGSYSELEKEIDRLKNNLEKSLEYKKVAENSSSLHFDDKAKSLNRLEGEINSLENQIKSLEEIQKAYNEYIDNLKEIQDLYNSIEKVENLEEKLNSLRDKVSKAKSLLPESLLKEAMQKIQEYIKTRNNNVVKPKIEFHENEFQVSFKEEIDKLVSQMNNILKDKSVEELRYGDLINSKNDLLRLIPVKEELFSRIKASQKLIDKATYEELMSQNVLITKKIDESMKSIDANKRERDAIKKLINKELKDDKKKISILDKKRNEFEDKVNNPEKYKLSQEEVDKLIFALKVISDDRNMLIGRVRELNVNLNRVNDGIAIKKEFKDSLLVEPKTKSDFKAFELSNPKPKPKAKPEPSKTQNGNSSSSSSTKSAPDNKAPVKGSEEKRKTGEKEIPKAVNPNSIEDLIKNGKLPRFLDFDNLKKIFYALNIPVKDKNTVLNPEQIDRLQNDHEIQVLLLCEKVYDRNEKKVSEYDLLISKYESILKDKMKNHDHIKNFSPAYIQKVQNLLGKLKYERAMYIERNQRLKANLKIGNLDLEYSGKNVLANIDDKNNAMLLDTVASVKNDKLRSKYQKLDGLREKKYKSKFRNKIHEKRIQKVLKRIEELKSKKAAIASKQTQIINSNTDLYIKKVTERLQKYSNRQNSIERSVDKINDIGERIEMNHQERKDLLDDYRKEPNFLDKMSIAFEDGRLERETDRLETQRDIENLIGRLR